MPVVHFSGILLRKAIKKMSSFASPGPDGIYGACLKYGGIFVEHALGDIYNESIENEVALQQSLSGTLFPKLYHSCRRGVIVLRPAVPTYCKLPHRHCTAACFATALLPRGWAGVLLQTSVSFVCPSWYVLTSSTVKPPPMYWRTTQRLPRRCLHRSSNTDGNRIPPVPT